LNYCNAHASGRNRPRGNALAAHVQHEAELECRRVRTPEARAVRLCAGKPLSVKEKQGVAD